MAKQYYSVLTDYGTQVIAGAIASKQPLQITQMAVGDGNGRATTPNSRNTGLVREVHRADISAISVDPRNDKQIIFELTIPENVGGFWIREMGIFDNQNRLVAYANCPDSFKPELTSGSGKVQVVRMILLVSSSDAITLKVDDSVIFATRGQLTPKTITATSQNAVDESGHSHEIDKASTSQAGIVTLDSSIDSEAENKAATPKAVKTAYDKAKAADDNANTRVSKSGGTVTGDIFIRRGDWSAVNCINSAGNLLVLEVNPESDSKSFGSLVYRNGTNGGNISKLSLPKASGTLAIKEDVGKTYRPLSDNAFDAKYGALKLISQTGNYAQLHLGGTDCTVIFEQQPDSKDYNLSIFTEKNGARPYGYFNIPKKGGMAITDKDYQCKTGKNGWIKLPNGVILQWFEGSSDQYKIKNNRFPIPFPNSCFHVFVTDLAYVNTADRMSVRSWNNSGVDVYGIDGSGSVSLFAIGN
ncbi:phage tail fiber repeat protein [Gallibacterium anatis UMN179]|uniref:Phage tail fiber repeat protein n=2 Tax=Gallibacterium anatis TaxID=750 RepID=F4HB18_GALAU|nr:phage tail protein [Gallibacterium anatis]AEC16250.1 phage tail fiber repeat protein [Gallibacterium anatis UMN179]